MLVYQVLYLEPNPSFKVLVITQLHHILQCLFHELKCYLFGGLLRWHLQKLLLRGFNLGLLQTIGHQLGEHVAENFHILMVNFDLKVLEACLDDVAIQLFGDVQFGDQIHVAVHLLFPALI